MLVRQGMRVDAFVETLDDGEEQLVLSEVREPGVCQGVEAARRKGVTVICRAVQPCAITCRRSAMNLRLRQKRGEVCNAKFVLARGREVWLKNPSQGLSECWRVFCRE